jgi:hypothetical protein
MFYFTLALVLAAPVCVMAWHYVRLELQLRTEDKVCARGLELIGSAAISAFIDLADDRPFGITAPRMDAFHSAPPMTETDRNV